MPWRRRATTPSAVAPPEAVANVVRERDPGPEGRIGLRLAERQREGEGAGPDRERQVVLVEDAFVLTTSMNLYLLRPIAEGTLTARASVVHPARTSFVAEAVLTDDRDRQVDRASGTFVRGRTPLTEDIGYRL